MRPPLALHDGLQDLVIPSGLAGRSTCPRLVPVWFYIGVTACNVHCAVPSSYVMLLIGLCQLYRLYVCQYGVFNLPVQLDIFPPILPTYWCVVAVDKVLRRVWISWCCRAYDTGSAHFIPSVEVKMLFMSAG